MLGDPAGAVIQLAALAIKPIGMHPHAADRASLSALSSAWYLIIPLCAKRPRLAMRRSLEPETAATDVV
jgi:hypothetical protein